MTDILLIGCLGRLGTEIGNCISEFKNYRIIAGIDIKDQDFNTQNYNVYDNIQKVIDNEILADVVIDFSHPSALAQTLDYCSKNGVPLILGTTGLNNSDKKNISAHSKKIPIFWSVNMSIGINILTSVCGAIAEMSNNIFDIDIIEKHHNKKIDHPSGTAKMIAESMKSKFNMLNSQKTILTENEAISVPRSNSQIKIHSIRAGNVPGEHSVVFSCEDETLTVSHTASSKKVFAKGAIKVIDFITKQPPGLYNSISPNIQA